MYSINQSVGLFVTTKHTDANTQVQIMTHTRNICMVRRVVGLPKELMLGLYGLPMYWKT